jgi:hypothetical protein
MLTMNSDASTAITRAPYAPSTPGTIAFEHPAHQHRRHRGTFGTQALYVQRENGHKRCHKVAGKRNPSMK